jgi:pimeloyl-ACP methyl ester carboxylesterase
MNDIAAEHAAAMRGAFAQPVDLLGLSTGGSIAQQIAAEHPDVVRRLVLVSTGARLGPAAKQLQRQLAARIRRGAYRQAAAVFAADLAPWAPLAVPAALTGWMLGPRLLPTAGLSDMATTAEAEDRFDLAELPTIQAPTLIVAGGRDRYYGPELIEETAALITGCRVVIRPRRGHISVLWSPRSRADIHEFLKVGARPTQAQAVAS